ncbi:MAG: hypothetical protein AAFV96_05870, partial [Pseudomonadota bacterium]
ASFSAATSTVVSRDIASSAAQDPALAAQLVEVAARWQAMRGHLAPLAGDAVPDAAALDAMSRDTTVLVAALKEAVALYENEL